MPAIIFQGFYRGIYLIFMIKYNYKIFNCVETADLNKANYSSHEYFHVILYLTSSFKSPQ